MVFVDTTVLFPWRPLFKNDGTPTGEMDDLLKVLAAHLFQPDQFQHSLFPPYLLQPDHNIVEATGGLMMPNNLRLYFQTTQPAHYPFPWEGKYYSRCQRLRTIADWDVLDVLRLQDEDLSRLYCNLRAEHHLVQPYNNHAPRIPGLTRNGFIILMTWLVRAYPREQYEMIHSLMYQRPILPENILAKWFPKDRNSIYFSERPNLVVRNRLENIITRYSGINVHKPPVKTMTITEPPPVSAGTAPHHHGGLFGGTTTATNRAIPGTPVLSSSNFSWGLQNHGPSIDLEERPQPHPIQLFGGSVHEDSQKAEVVNKQTNASHDDFDRYRQHRREPQQRLFPFCSSASRREGSKAVVEEAYDGKNDENQSGKGQRCSGAELHGCFRPRLSSAGLRTGHDGDIGDHLDVFRFLVEDEDEGKEGSHEQPRDEDRPRDRDNDDLDVFRYLVEDEGQQRVYDSRNGSEKDGDENRRWLERIQYGGQEVKCAVDFSEGSWTEVGYSH
ncbi:hypothetical protein ACJ72_03103 [Emergomyces africanus]|uniref:DUF7514 domain-containing protein n=1 Tax=Emergomyces africanus TaxID=1955775 RepID=A0A1B7P0I8_9EURO|nr:hypothetical protein ACJ72_03103 [Emergomyces africanus]